MMDPFLKHLDSLQQAILDSDHPMLIPGQLCQCRYRDVLYYCKDCFSLSLHCKSCIISAHKHLPFHWVQEWSGTYFHCTSLSNLVLVLLLRHHVEPCPNHPTTSVPCKMIVIHTNGVHECRLEFCHCIDALAEPLQLMCLRLFPVTMERPGTLFTFSVLDDFQMLSLTSKIPAYDYWNVLVNFTDHVFPKNIQVCILMLIPVIYSDRCSRINITNFFGWSMSGTT